MKKLSETANKNPFKIPKNYFEDFDRRIINSTSSLPNNVKKIGFYDRFKPYLLIAASVTILVFLSFAAIKLLGPDKSKMQLSEVLNTEYSQSYINDIDILTLEQNASSLVLADEGPDVNNTDIIDYLLLENIEINDIYEQL
ncbi:MAG TPA: hypothetical protein VIK07_07460 [Bacteroidales bacterium]